MVPGGGEYAGWSDFPTLFQSLQEGGFTEYTVVLGYRLQGRVQDDSMPRARRSLSGELKRCPFKPSCSAACIFSCRSSMNCACRGSIPSSRRHHV
jgi:hypothetical protein